MPSNDPLYEYLIYLRLDHNKLSRLPSTISKLQQLRYLTLNNNDLESLPDDIDRLQWLQWLGLSNNRIQVLPESIKDLRHLKYFDAWNNGLRKLPDMDTQDWMNMEYFDIRHNPKSSFASERFRAKGRVAKFKRNKYVQHFSMLKRRFAIWFARLQRWVLVHKAMCNGLLVFWQRKWAMWWYGICIFICVAIHIRRWYIADAR